MFGMDGDAGSSELFWREPDAERGLHVGELDLIGPAHAGGTARSGHV